MVRAIDDIDQRARHFLRDDERHLRRQHRCFAIDAGQFLAIRPRVRNELHRSTTVYAQQTLHTGWRQAVDRRKRRACFSQTIGARQQIVSSAAVGQFAAQDLAEPIDRLLREVSVGRQLAADNRNKPRAICVFLDDVAPRNR